MSIREINPLDNFFINIIDINERGYKIWKLLNGLTF